MVISTPSPVASEGHRQTTTTSANTSNAKTILATSCSRKLSDAVIAISATAIPQGTHSQSSQSETSFVTECVCGEHRVSCPEAATDFSILGPAWATVTLERILRPRFVTCTSFRATRRVASILIGASKGKRHVQSLRDRHLPCSGTRGAKINRGSIVDTSGLLLQDGAPIEPRRSGVLTELRRSVHAHREPIIPRRSAGSSTVEIVCQCLS